MAPLIPLHKRRKARLEADRIAFSQLQVQLLLLTSGLRAIRLMVAEQRRQREMARLIEITGLNVDGICSDIRGIKQAAADVNEHAPRLKAELEDIRDQLLDHRNSIASAADSRGNASSSLSKQSEKLRAAATGGTVTPNGSVIDRAGVASETPIVAREALTVAPKLPPAAGVLVDHGVGQSAAEAHPAPVLPGHGLPGVQTPKTQNPY